MVMHKKALGCFNTEIFKYRYQHVNKSCLSGCSFHKTGSIFCMWKTVRVCRCTVYTRCIVNERWPGLSGWFVQDDVSVGGRRERWVEEGGGSMQRMRWHIPDSPHTAPGTAGTSGTSAAGHSPLHCGSSPGLQKDTDAHACTHTHTHNSQCNYSQSRILQACCSANREGAFVMQQKGIR